MKIKNLKIKKSAVAVLQNIAVVLEIIVLIKLPFDFRILSMIGKLSMPFSGTKRHNPDVLVLMIFLRVLLDLIHESRIEKYAL